jgi:DNA-binding beta-propeller fold protein YncE
MRLRLLPWLILSGCMADNALVGKSMDDSDAEFPAADGDADTDSDADADDGDSETETDPFALAPAETDIYVFIANPDRDTVTRVNVYSLEVRTTPVGKHPSIVQTTPDYSTAVVFTDGDDSVSIIDAQTLAQTVVKVRANFNQMVMSPDGRWVALFHDVNAERSDDPPPTGLVSYNEVSFVDVTSGKHFPMAVDYDPREIRFTPDGSLATVVTDTTLGVVDLTLPTPYPRLVPVTDDLVDPPKAEEVVIAPDGSYAFVRQFGATDLAVVNLLDDQVDRVPVGENPTDLDLSPDGTKAVVVSRGSKQLYVLDVADPLAPPEILDLPPEEQFGSVLFDPTGRQAVLYTTASPVDRYASWNLTDGSITVRSLVKPVASMAITPTGGSLLVFHTREDAPDADSSSPFYGRWALTLVELSDFRSNPLRLPAEPIGFANSNNGLYGYFIMDGQKYLEALDYTTLLYDEVPLKSVPVFVGVLPDLDLTDGDEPPAWASQEHELGRISFFDVDDRSVETITGFELNSRVEED